ncbi:MAG TPA: hypothetical protein VGG97_17365 [Bryobacteraceae bacterium]
MGSKRRIRRPAEPSFPYAKSIVISWGLIVATMLAAAAFSDPKSGDIKHPALAWSMIAGLPIAIPAVFFMEFKRKNRSKQPKAHDEF